MVVFEAGLMGKIGKQRETRVWGLGSMVETLGVPHMAFNSEKMYWKK